MLDLKPLTHAHTPFELQTLNQEIESLLGAQDTDTTYLAQKIDQRHVIITEHLKSLPQQERKAFIDAEVPINDYLNTFVGAMLKESGNVLFNLRKGRKAVDKYKQIN